MLSSEYTKVLVTINLKIIPIKTLYICKTLCVSVPFIILINISVENFKRKTYPYLNKITIFIYFIFNGFNTIRF
jgi:hypothetical protein